MKGQTVLINKTCPSVDSDPAMMSGERVGCALDDRAAGLR